MCMQVIGANVTPKIPSELTEGMVGGKKLSEGREGGGNQRGGNRHGGVDRCGCGGIVRGCSSPFGDGTIPSKIPMAGSKDLGIFCISRHFLGSRT